MCRKIPLGFISLAVLLPAACDDSADAVGDRARQELELRQAAEKAERAAKAAGEELERAGRSVQDAGARLERAAEKGARKVKEAADRLDKKAAEEIRGE